MVSTTPFSIPFCSPYTLEKDIQFRTFYTGEALPYVEQRVIGYNATQLIIGVQSKGQKEHKVTFNISQDTLQVSCNCKSTEQTLCAHGYHALHELCWNRRHFFGIFAPGNKISIALENKSVFHLNYSKPNDFIVPDKSLGHLYDFEKINTLGLEELSALPAVAVPVQTSEVVWMLVYSSYRWQNYLPVLVPVKGIFDRTGNHIKSFGKGFGRISNEKLLNTPGRQQLYNLSEAMFSSLPERDTFEAEDLVAGKIYVAANIKQWENALPILSEQRFVYKFRLAHTRYFMKRPPGRNYLEHITISTERPQLQFILKDKVNYSQLSLEYLVRGVPIKSPVEDALFFVCNGTQYHLLASLRDAAMVQWMSGFYNLITVLKTGLPTFEKEILQRIEAMYPILRK